MLGRHAVPTSLGAPAGGSGHVDSAVVVAAGVAVSGDDGAAGAVRAIVVALVAVRLASARCPSVSQSVGQRASCSAAWVGGGMGGAAANSRSNVATQRAWSGSKIRTRRSGALRREGARGERGVVVVVVVGCW
jgi:hypothetical protein